MDTCVVTGNLFIPEAAGLAGQSGWVTVHYAEKSGELIEMLPFTRHPESGVITLTVPRASSIFVSGNYTGLYKDSSGNYYSESNPKILAVPNAETAILEDLVAVSSVPVEGLVMQDEGVALTNLVGTLNITGAAGSVAETSPGVAALSFAAMVNSLAGLSDPGADRIAFWDESANALAWLSLGTNLSITGTTLDAAGGGGLWGGIGGNIADQTDLIALVGTQLTQAEADALYSALAHNHSGVYQPLDTQLTDIAALAYAGNALKVVRVNVGESAFELASVSGTPGGSDTQIQFNDGGAFGGDAGLVYNKTTNLLTITGGSIVSLGAGNGSEQYGANGTTRNTTDSLAIMGENDGGNESVVVGPASFSWGGRNVVVGKGAEMQSGGQGTIAGFGHLGLGGEATGFGAQGRTGFGSFNFGFANEIIPSSSGIGIGDNISVKNATPALAKGSIGLGGGMTIGHRYCLVVGWGPDTSHTTPITTADSQAILGLFDGIDLTAEGIRELIIGQGPTVAVPLSIRIHPTDASGTNISSTGHLRLEGSRPTGTGTGSSVILATAPPTTSGSSLAALIDRITVPSTGQITFSGADAGGGYGLIIGKDGKLGTIKLGATSPDAYIYKIFNAASYRGVGLSYNAKLNESSAAYEVDSASVAQGVFEYNVTDGWTFYTAAASGSLTLGGAINNNQNWGIGRFAVAGQRLTVKGAGATSAAYSMIVQNSADATIIAVRNDKNVGINYDGWGTNAVGVLSLGTGTPPSSSPADAVQLYSADFASGDARFFIRSETGNIISIGNGAVAVNGIKVVGAQQAAIADATDAPSAISQLNLLLAAARTHGWIAT